MPFDACDTHTEAVVQHPLWPAPPVPDADPHVDPDADILLPVAGGGALDAPTAAKATPGTPVLRLDPAGSSRRTGVPGVAFAAVGASSAPPPATGRRMSASGATCGSASGTGGAGQRGCWTTASVWVSQASNGTPAP
ncbi:hypothetical protein [Cellulomonas sp. HZM]|uniref:hypothetical protein n=1 Tax=Cellulomonas sp. HZM TaxID=1454010 RepID=UPI0004930819|nr:hypothetical protein [Cellulomonas sp. HZM]